MTLLQCLHLSTNGLLLPSYFLSFLCSFRPLPPGPSVGANTSALTGEKHITVDEGDLTLCLCDLNILMFDVCVCVCLCVKEGALSTQITVLSLSQGREHIC